MKILTNDEIAILEVCLEIIEKEQAIPEENDYIGQGWIIAQKSFSEVIRRRFGLE